jgi:hypothetical protein
METADLVQWLHETYYSDDKPPYFTKIDLQAVSKVLLSLFRFRPSERSYASDIILKQSLGNRSSAEPLSATEMARGIDRTMSFADVSDSAQH